MTPRLPRLCLSRCRTRGNGLSTRSLARLSRSRSSIGSWEQFDSRSLRLWRPRSCGAHGSKRAPKIRLSGWFGARTVVGARPSLSTRSPTRSRAGKTDRYHSLHAGLDTTAAGTSFDGSSDLLRSGAFPHARSGESPSPKLRGDGLTGRERQPQEHRREDQEDDSDTGRVTGEIHDRDDEEQSARALPNACLASALRGFSGHLDLLARIGASRLNPQMVQ